MKNHGTWRKNPSTSNCSNTIPFASILTVCRIGIVSKYLNLPTYAPFFLLYSLIMLQNKHTYGLAHLVERKLFQNLLSYCAYNYYWARERMCKSHSPAFTYNQMNFRSHGKAKIQPMTMIDRERITFSYCTVVQAKKIKGTVQYFVRNFRSSDDGKQGVISNITVRLILAGGK